MLRHPGSSVHSYAWGEKEGGGVIEIMLFGELQSRHQIEPNKNHSHWGISHNQPECGQGVEEINAPTSIFFHPPVSCLSSTPSLVKLTQKGSDEKTKVQRYTANECQFWYLNPSRQTPNILIVLIIL